MYNPAYEHDLIRYLGGNVEIQFVGWRSTMCDLRYHGWEMYMERSYHRGDTRFLFEHRDLRLAAFMEDYDVMRRERIHRLTISQVVPTRDTRVITRERPDYMNMEMRLGPRAQEMGDLMRYEFCLADILQPVNIEKLLVAREDEKTVDDLLAHILTKQGPLRQEIAERRVKENLIERPSAQIVKLFAA